MVFRAIIYLRTLLQKDIRFEEPSYKVGIYIYIKFHERIISQANIHNNQINVEKPSADSVFMDLKHSLPSTSAGLAEVITGLEETQGNSRVPLALELTAE